MPNKEKMTDEAINNIFQHHVPSGNQPVRYAIIRKQCGDLAKLFRDSCPAADETDKAIECLAMAMMYANASIARNEPSGKVDPPLCAACRSKLKE